MGGEKIAEPVFRIVELVLFFVSRIHLTMLFQCARQLILAIVLAIAGGRR